MDLRGPRDPQRGANAVAGRPPEDFGIRAHLHRRDPAGLLRHPRPGQGHGRERRAGSMCFPSFPRFCGQLLIEDQGSRTQAAAMVRAYNDWHIEEWAGTYPGRIIPLALPMMWDPEAAADEVRRVAKAKGATRSTFSSNPYDVGAARASTTSTGTRSGQACVDEGTVVCMHLGSNSPDFMTSPDAPIELDLLAITRSASSRPPPTCCGVSVFRKFPDAARRAVRGRHRLDPVLPGEGRSHLPPHPALERHGSRWSAAVGDLPRTRDPVLHRRLVRHREPAPPEHRQHHAGSATIRTPTRPGRTRRRC